MRWKLNVPQGSRDLAERENETPTTVDWTGHISNQGDFMMARRSIRERCDSIGK